MLKIGDKAPEFSLPDQDGRIHTLSGYKGKWVLVYFYPKDNTPGCTKEACAIRDVWSEFAADPGPGFSPPLWEENLTEAEIKAALSKIYRSFYLRPGVILRRLWRVRSLSGLASGARMGAKILGLRSKQEET